MTQTNSLFGWFCSSNANWSIFSGVEGLREEKLPSHAEGVCFTPCSPLTFICLLIDIFGESQFDSPCDSDLHFV